MDNQDQVYSLDYYALLTDPKLNIEINDIQHISYVLNSIDIVYKKYDNELRIAILHEVAYRGLNKDIGKELYDSLLNMMKEEKDNLKKEIIVSGHLSNITNRTTVRTATIFYQNLKKTVEQQLDIAFSLIVSRLKNFYIREI